jgi:hypothetical protein
MFGFRALGLAVYEALRPIHAVGLKLDCCTNCGGNLNCSQEQLSLLANGFQPMHPAEQADLSGMNRLMQWAE